jgi:GrpB-like predicted nucleotidyltransferase (UPF0157 family)
MTELVGLKRGTVSLVAYQPEWANAFEKEKKQLQGVLGDYVSAIKHVGSTSVPALAAKPIIDIIAAVDNLSVYQQFIEPLTALGYEFMPERVFTDRVFFPKGPRENRTHYLSLVVRGSDSWKKTIAFRDYLRKDESARSKYQAVKTELAVKYPNDRASYTKAKEQLIEQLLKEALK